MTLPTNWTFDHINAILAEQREESLTLDYKASKALWDNKELAKDVSAFANSAGGTIIYGILEGEKDEKHKPVALDEGINPTKKTKESIENIIIDSIRPRISSVYIHPIELPSGNQFFVIEIPQSKDAPHMANHRYYKRYNFQSVPMEDYEVRDVMNRQTGPDLNLDFQMVELDIQQGFLTIRPNIRNRASTPASYATAIIWFDARLFSGTTPSEVLAFFCGNIDHGFTVEEEKIEIEGRPISCYRGIVQFLASVPVFGSVSIHLISHNRGRIQFKLDNSEDSAWLGTYFIKWQLEAPNMISKEAIEKLTISRNQDEVKVYKQTLIE